MSLQHWTNRALQLLWCGHNCFRNAGVKSNKRTRRLTLTNSLERLESRVVTSALSLISHSGSGESYSEITVHKDDGPPDVFPSTDSFTLPESLPPTTNGGFSYHNFATAGTATTSEMTFELFNTESPTGSTIRSQAVLSVFGEAFASAGVPPSTTRSDYRRSTGRITAQFQIVATSELEHVGDLVAVTIAGTTGFETFYGIGEAVGTYMVSGQVDDIGVYDAANPQLHIGDTFTIEVNFSAICSRETGAGSSYTGANSSISIDLRPAAELPDLKVSFDNTQVVPTDAPDMHLNHFFGGETINVPLKVTNDGNGAAHGNVDVTLYLSDTPVFAPSTAHLFKQVSNTLVDLERNGVKNIDLTDVTIPRGILVAGEKAYLIARIEAAFSETNRNNNDKASDKQYEFVGDPIESVFDDDQYLRIVRSAVDPHAKPIVPPSVNSNSDIKFVRFFENGLNPKGAEQDFLGPYLDSEGIATIGVGINLQELLNSASPTSQQLKLRLAQAVVEFYNSKAGKKTKKKDPLPDEVLETIGPDGISLIDGGTVIIKFLIDNASALTFSKKRGWEVTSSQAITKTRQEELFAQALADHQQEFSTTIADLDTYRTSERIALSSIAYNLGISKLNSKFPSFVRAIQNDQIVRAGFELVNATRASDLPDRTQGEYQKLLETHRAELGQIL